MNDDGTIKSTRWDYKFLKSFSPPYVENVEIYGETICGWWGNVVASMFLAIMISLCSGVLGASAIFSPIVALFFNVDYLPVYAQLFFSIGLTIWTLVIIFTVFHCIYKSLSYIKTNKTPNNEPGLIKQRYRAWKDKVCYNVKIVHVDKEN